MALYIGMLLYLSLQTSQLLNPSALTKHVQMEKENEDMMEVYQSIIEEVNSLLIKEEHISKANLKLDDIATYTNTKPHLLSKALNVVHRKSLSEFLNDRRIEQAVSHIIHIPELSIKEIMFKVGYNSKSLFFSEFKKRLGQTPNSYKTTRAAS